MNGMSRLLIFVTGVVLLMIVATIFTKSSSSWPVSIFIMQTPAIQPAIVTCGARLDDLLLTPTELRRLLYDERGNQTSNPATLSDCRYANLIRSFMTRPDPSQRLQLASKSTTRRIHFSDVSLFDVLHLILWMQKFDLAFHWRFLASWLHDSRQTVASAFSPDFSSFLFNQ
jgi:hypothetical protein